VKSTLIYLGPIAAFAWYNWAHSHDWVLVLLGTWLAVVVWPQLVDWVRHLNRNEEK
jgi:hypothetical protein